MIGARPNSTLPDGLADYLRRQSGDIKVEPVLLALGDVVADVCFIAQALEQRPEPEAMRQEAQQLAADLLSVRERLLQWQSNPYQRAHTDAYLWRTWHTTTRKTVNNAGVHMLDLAHALSVPVPPIKRGRRRKHSHDEALATLAAAIEGNSNLKTTAARDLAADLLRQCGIDAPQSERQHRRKAKQNTDRT